MELHEFLEARIADDEAVAKKAISEAGSGDWDDNWDYWGCCDLEGVLGFGHFNKKNEYSTIGVAVQDISEYVARFDPARILAECAAKRGLVEMHVGAFAYYGDPDLHSNKCMGCGNEDEVDPVTANVEDCPTLRILAATYSSHNDFNPDWAVA